MHSQCNGNNQRKKKKEEEVGRKERRRVGEKIEFHGRWGWGAQSQHSMRGDLEQTSEAKLMLNNKRTEKFTNGDGW